MIAICGVIAECDSWQVIALFGQKGQPWFKRFFKPPHGIPAHDTFERVFNPIDPRAFDNCLVQWLKDITDMLGLRHIAVEGKALRHSCCSRKGLRMLHSVSAWATQQQLLLGQVMTNAESNEVAAIPQLLQLLDVHGALVTLDAMGCLNAIAQQIVEQTGDYNLVVKENQEHLLDDIQTTVQKALDGALPAKDVKQYSTTVQTGHGRREERIYTVIHNVQEIRQREEWKNLKTVGMYYSERTAAGRTSAEVRYFISSRRLSAWQSGEALRKHGDIENNFHGQLDVMFAKFASTIHRPHAGANFATLRRGQTQVSGLGYWLSRGDPRGKRKACEGLTRSPWGMKASWNPIIVVKDLSRLVDNCYRSIQTSFFKALVSCSNRSDER